MEIITYDIIVWYIRIWYSMVYHDIMMWYTIIIEYSLLLFHVC